MINSSGCLCRLADQVRIGTGSGEKITGNGRAGGDDYRRCQSEISKEAIYEDLHIDRYYARVLPG
jgi:hypothetical protein